jgi:hypothetical protein
MPDESGEPVAGLDPVVVAGAGVCSCARRVEVVEAPDGAVLSILIFLHPLGKGMQGSG